MSSTLASILKLFYTDAAQSFRYPNRAVNYSYAVSSSKLIHLEFNMVGD